MKYKEKLFVEELISLLKGKTIDFIDDEDNNIKVKISGKNFKDKDTLKHILKELDDEYKR